MPSSSNLLPRCISFSEVDTLLPERWKRISNNRNKSILGSFLTSFKYFSHQGNLLKAFRASTVIRFHAIASSSLDLILHSLSSFLLRCTDLKSLQEGKQLHAHIITLGLEVHPSLVPKLITFYTSFNLFVNARFVTESSNIWHPLPWNILISSYVTHGYNEDTIFAFQHMVKKGIRPDKFTYPSVLKACGELLNLRCGKAIHLSLEISSLEHDLFVQNALVSMYSKCGEVEVARKIFNRMPYKNSVSWNSMISGYASKDMWNELFELFETMRKDGAELNIITWNIIAGGCLRTNNFKGTVELISQMRASGICLDYVTVIIGLTAISHMPILRLGKEIHGLALRSYHHYFHNVQNSLITMYTRCNDLVHAHIVFHLVEAKSTITWNSVISGYCHWDKSEEALFLFREMLLSGIRPNYVTIVSILPLCTRVADLQHGREFHCYITRRKEFEDHTLLWNALVDMYARVGKVSKARLLFNLLKNKDAVTYTSLIAEYGMQGDGKEAIKLFEEMIRADIKPDHITMIAVLSACSHSGLVVQGQILFEKMQSIYGIMPRLEHFSCMADLYGRVGLLKKAREIITMMPWSPIPEMFVSLIGACRIHEDIEMGEWAAEKLLEMRPHTYGYYVLVANMYVSAGCWSKVEKIRSVMRNFFVEDMNYRSTQTHT